MGQAGIHKVTSDGFVPKTHKLNLIMRNTGEPKMKDILQNTNLYSSKVSRSGKTKKD